MDKAKEIYGKVNKFVETNVVIFVIVIVLVLLWMLFLGDLIGNMQVTGEWEQDNSYLIVEDDNCEVGYDEDDLEDIDCVVTGGQVLFTENGNYGYILDGDLFIVGAGLYEKQ